MKYIDNKKLDIEVNSACAKNECTVEPLADESVCTKSSLSSIPIEKDAEVIEHMKTTGSSLASGKANQFIAQGITKGITQGKQKSYRIPVPSGVICIDISVKARNSNSKISLAIYTPAGKCCGTFYGTGSIIRRIKPGAGSKYVPQGNWMLLVSGDDCTITAKKHY